MRLGAGAGPGQLELLLTLLVIGHDAPGVGAGRPIQSHTPPNPLSGLSVVERNRRGEGEAAVLCHDLGHRDIGPAVPAACQPGVTKRPSPLSGHVNEALEGGGCKPNRRVNPGGARWKCCPERIL